MEGHYSVIMIERAPQPLPPSTPCLGLQRDTGMYRWLSDLPLSCWNDDINGHGVPGAPRRSNHQMLFCTLRPEAEKKLYSKGWGLILPGADSIFGCG